MNTKHTPSGKNTLQERFCIKERIKINLELPDCSFKNT